MNAKQQFELVAMDVKRRRDFYQGQLNHLVRKAVEDGFVVTVEVEGSIEGMGHSRLVADVRDGRPVYQHLMQLAQAAKAEAQAAQHVLAPGDLPGEAGDQHDQP